MSLAKAMNGEESSARPQEKKIEMTTTVMVFFTSTSFSDESIMRLKSRLAEKEIAFDKKGLFDFAIDIDMNKSSILFGLKEPNQPLAALASEAFKSARTKTDVIAKASGRQLGNLVGISGCGADLEGTVTISDKGNLLGTKPGTTHHGPGQACGEIREEVRVFHKMKWVCNGI